MTARQQLGTQLKNARIDAGLSLRALATLVQIPATTIEGYEKGTKIPADAFLRIAAAVNQRRFKIDEYSFEVNRTNGSEKRTELAEQMNFTFSAQYSTSNATVKISPGRIALAFDAKKLSAKKL